MGLLLSSVFLAQAPASDLGSESAFSPTECTRGPRNPEVPSALGSSSSPEGVSVLVLVAVVAVPVSSAGPDASVEWASFLVAPQGSSSDSLADIHLSTDRHIEQLLLLVVGDDG